MSPQPVSFSSNATCVRTVDNLIPIPLAICAACLPEATPARISARRDVIWAKISSFAIGMTHLRRGEGVPVAAPLRPGFYT